jgi:hypothetical protein
LRQAEDSTLFSLRPQALAANIRTDPRKDLRAEHPQKKDADYDGYENANDDEQLSGDGKAAEHSH